MKRISSLIFVLIIVSPAAADTVYVGPGGHATIQAGIDAAQNGDTVLVADGTWTGSGNRMIEWFEKSLTVRSEGGPKRCIIDAQAGGRAFYEIESSAGSLSGFSIVNCSGAAYGGAIYCDGTVSIDNCIFINNQASSGGGAIYANCGGFSARYLRISNSIFLDNHAVSGGAVRTEWGHGVLMSNCLVSGNSAEYGGGINIFYPEGNAPEIRNCTIVDNTGNSGSAVGLTADYGGTPPVNISNSILWNNGPGVPIDEDIGQVSVTYSDVQGGWPGEGNIDVVPLFITGPDGDYYLSQISAGQGVDSPCLDAGDPASSMIHGTTRTDRFLDTGIVDMGYHYLAKTVNADLSCEPASGTLPFKYYLRLTVTNVYTGYSRTMAARIDVRLGNGRIYSNWRAGITPLTAGESYIRSWSQDLPARIALVGDNIFILVAEDVSYSPYNLPPYPPAGDTDTDACTVVGIAP